MGYSDHRVEDMNYYSDHRVRAGQSRNWYESLDTRRMKATVLIEDETGEETKEVSFEYQVCPTCDGRGNHVNPSIDSNGLSAEDFAEDPDFAEDYMSGTYDVTCYGCKGERVVPVCTDEEHLAELEQQAIFDAQCQAEYDAERRMGA